ncbi:MAG: hypothetical protein HQL84_15030 [Magnetococcales bacterium]|nr:hypothetical protein [Magnetococcales bacterium]MBF0151333.1 hypothetical protein [Magnetococcales bacterium]
MTHTLRKAAMAALVLPLWITASGCGGGSGSSDSSASTTSLSGTVIDGPVTNSTVTITDASGKTVGTATSGSDAKYSISIPAGTTFPLRVTTSGGTDQVTGETPMTMDSLVTDSKQTTANVTPITSVVYQAAVANAGSLDKVTATTVSTVKTDVISKFGFGIDSEEAGFDPIASPVTSSNITSVMKSSEAMAETVRRAVGSNPTTMTEAFRVIGEDMADGSMDGKKAGAALTQPMPTGFNATTMVSAISQQKALVGVEVVNNNMKVTKADGTQLSSDEVKTRFSQSVNKVDPTLSPTAALAKMEAMPISDKQKSQITTDVGNAKTVMETLGLNTATMTSLESSVKNLEVGKTGTSKIDQSIVSNVESSVNTVTGGIRNNTYTPAALSSAVSAIAPAPPAGSGATGSTGSSTTTGTSPTGTSGSTSGSTGSTTTSGSTSGATGSTTSGSTSGATGSTTSGSTGGSTGTTTTPSGSGGTNVVTGTMSAGALIDTDVTVTMKDKDGDSVTCSTSGATYTCDIDKMKTPNPPYFVQVTGKAASKEFTLFSVAQQAGQANVNPMTNLVVSNAIGGDPAGVFSNLGSTAVTEKVAKIDTPAKLEAKVNEFKGSFLKTMEEQGYTGAQVDPFAAKIEQGKGLDKVFDGVQISVNAAGGYQVIDKLKLASDGKEKATLLSGNVATLDVTKATIDPTKISSGSKDFTDPAIKKKLAHPLTLGNKVSVVDNKTKGGTGTKATTTRSVPWNRALRTASASEMETISPVSDFYMDETHVYVSERSGEALKTVNEILCSIGQTRYDKMLNQGPYKAQLDQSKCSNDKKDPSKAGKGSQNQSSGAGAPKFETWIIDSQRDSDDVPQIVKVWVNDISEEEPGAGNLIYAFTEIYKGASANNPYGVFNMDFKGVAVGENGIPTQVESTRGSLDVEETTDNRVKVTFLDQYKHHEDTATEKVILLRSADGKTGTGSVDFTEPEWDEASQKMVMKNNVFHFAFDENWFLRQDDSGAERACLSRNQFKTDVWSYGVYHLSPPPANSGKTWAPGDELIIDSGFPISYTDTNGKEWHGWVGYFGPWFPGEVTIANGASVTKQVFERTGVQEAPYTLFQSGGKLIRHTKVAQTLADMKNIPLQYSEENRTTHQRTDYMVEWNGTAFIKKSKLNQTNWFFEKLTTETPIDLTTLQWDGLQFWGEALGGNVRVKLDNCVNSKKTQWAEVETLFAANKTDEAKAKEQVIMADTTPETWSCTASNTTAAIFNREEMIQPGTAAHTAVPTSLLCGESCPNPDKISATDGSSPFFDNKSMGGEAAGSSTSQSFYSYTFDKDAMVLKYNSANIASTANNMMYQFGIHTGPLFENTTANLDAVKCDWNKEFICPWQAWDRLDVFYTWETGPNNWNKYSALKDSSGNILKFDPPMEVTYSHTWNAGEVAKYNLKYEGIGNLQGIPGRCVGFGNDDEVNCGPETRWVPDFSIDTGAVVEDKDGNTYVVKALDVEERMIKDDAGCTGLTIEKQTFPSTVSWMNNEDPATRLGDPNSLTALPEAPAVINGIQQAE